MNNSNSTPDFSSFFSTPEMEMYPLPPQNPRKKKRTKLLRIGPGMTSRAIIVTKPNKSYARKPDPSAPKITSPCTECGRKFWSWKALFGHMRCHPERQWRGINPPPNFRRLDLVEYNNPYDDDDDNDYLEKNLMTEEDHEAAACLLLLANSPTMLMLTNGDNSDNTRTSDHVTTNIVTSNVGCRGFSDSDTMVVRDNNYMEGGAGAGAAAGPSNCRWFECSSCKKVFGSHQALGGHRASHKNVKGCFAITRTTIDDGEDEYHHHPIVADHHHDHRNIADHHGDHHLQAADKMVMVLGHKCSICLRVFSSGQALGGHKRCHWEKGDEPSSSLASNQFVTSKARRLDLDLDLNLPRPVQYDQSVWSSFSSGLSLELRLGL